MTTGAESRETPSWSIKGHVILACNCDYGCPCNFNGLPTTGSCEGNWNWHITEGKYGTVPLAGLTFSLAVIWPGAIHQGNGEAILVIDEKANAAQRAAVTSLLSGQAGGPWKIISTTITKTHGPEYVPFDVSIGEFNSRVVAGKVIDLKMQPVQNPVTGAEVHPRAILPEGFIFKEGFLGKSATFRVNGAIRLDHSGKYAAAAGFEYAGP